MFTGIVDGNRGDAAHAHLIGPGRGGLDAAFAAGILLAFWKATEGLTYNDSTFAEAVTDSRAAGMLPGAYHFLRGAHPGEVEADHFLMRVEPLLSGGPLLLACDWEAGDAPTDHARAFVARVHDRTGRWPMLYSGLSFLWKRVGKGAEPVLGMCDLWLAAYGPDPVKIKVPPAWPRGWTLQQYTNGGAGPKDVANYPRKTPGFGPGGGPGGVDRSCFRGTADDLRAYHAAHAVSALLPSH